MERKNWIGAIILGILGIFGIGAGVRKHNRKKQDEIKKAEREQRKRDRLIDEVQRNQMALQMSQRETLKMMKKMQEEMGMDPTEIDTELEEN